MGKKRVAKKTAEEGLKESEQAQAVLERKMAKVGKRASRLHRGNVYIRSSYNNVMITIADEQGRVLSWATSGGAGFRGPKKATPFAASKVTELALERLGNIEIDEVGVYVNGVGSGRDAAIRTLMGRGLNVALLKDITPIPHNGCRPAKPRRV